MLNCLSQVRWRKMKDMSLYKRLSPRWIRWSVRLYRKRFTARQLKSLPHEIRMVGTMANYWVTISGVFHKFRARTASKTCHISDISVVFEAVWCRFIACWRTRFQLVLALLSVWAQVNDLLQHQHLAPTSRAGLTGTIPVAWVTGKTYTSKSIPT